MTYSEKIRSMSDEELSEFLESISTVSEAGREFTYIGAQYIMLRKGKMLEFLQSKTD